MPGTEDFNLDSSSQLNIIPTQKSRVNWSFIIVLIVVVVVALVLIFKPEPKTSKQVRKEKAGVAFDYLDNEDVKLAKLGAILPPGTGRIIPDEKHHWILTASSKCKVKSILTLPNVGVAKDIPLLELDKTELANKLKQYPVGA